MASTSLTAQGRSEAQGVAWRGIVWPLLVYSVLTALAIATLIPIVWMVLTAFKSAPEVAASPPTWIPHEWHP